MNTSKENYILLESIKLIIDRKTLQICSINLPTQLHTGLNIFEFFKTFKPVFNEYPEFNAFLTQLKIYQRTAESQLIVHSLLSVPEREVRLMDSLSSVTPNSRSRLSTRVEMGLEFSVSGNSTLFTTNIISSFHNNFNFYNKISNNHHIQNNIKQFTITLIPNDDTAVIVLEAYGLPMNQNYNITTNTYNTYNNNNNNTIKKKNINKSNQFEFNTEQLKHEISNSLNLINMSNILINNSFKNPELEKYTNIISNELQNTANILNSSNSSRLAKELITVKEFYGYISIFLENINIIYNINDDGLIKFETLTVDILNYSYLNINTSWFKIILDNIFKNIYGHIGDTYSLLLKVFNVYYNKELNKLCIDIINKKSDDIQQNTTRCNLYKQITDNYDLSHISNITSIKRTNSQGLKLINILCERQNIDWQLLELSDNEYVFKLSIPIYNLNMGTLPYNLANGCSPKESALKISNIYLNESNRETVI
jgi:hypothetical protein